MMPDEILSRRTIHEGWLGLSMLTLRQPDGSEIERELVEHPCGAAVLPFDPARRVAMLISESRPPLISGHHPPLVEAIAGALDGDEPEACARREALEEGGVRLAALEHVGHYWSTPATSTEQVDVYLARYAQSDMVAEGGGLAEEHERLSAIELPLDDLWRMVEMREIRDAKTLILLQALRLRRPELFTATAP